MKRTLPQNNSLHKYCTDLAHDLDAAGFEQREVFEQFKASFTIPFTMEAIKNIFREVAKAMYDVKSTAELDTVQMQKVYRVVDARISEITGCRCEWPSEQAMRYEREGMVRK